MWNLRSPVRDQTHTPCTGKQILNHWTTKEVPQDFWICILPRVCLLLFREDCSNLPVERSCSLFPSPSLSPNPLPPPSPVDGLCEGLKSTCLPIWEGSEPGGHLYPYQQAGLVLRTELFRMEPKSSQKSLWHFLGHKEVLYAKFYIAMNWMYPALQFNPPNIINWGHRFSPFSCPFCIDAHLSLHSGDSQYKLINGNEL